MRAPNGRSVPTQVAIEVGAEFPGWSRDGKYLYFSLGRSFFLYDIAAAMAARADSLRGAWQKRLAGDTLPVPGADTLPHPARVLAGALSTSRSPSPQRSRAASVALRGARIISMKGDEVIERGDIVVTDNRITAVGAAGQRDRFPPDATSIDVSGKTIIPGWVDVHAHTWPSPDVHKTAVPAFHANLAFGVTTMRDPQTNTSAIITYGDRLRAGDMLGPRFIGHRPGHLQRRADQHAAARARSRAALRRVLRDADDQAVPRR